MLCYPGAPYEHLPTPQRTPRAPECGDAAGRGGLNIRQQAPGSDGLASSWRPPSSDTSGKSLGFSEPWPRHLSNGNKILEPITELCLAQVGAGFQPPARGAVAAQE